MSQALDLYRASVPDKLQYAQALADSNLLPASFRRQPANVLLAIEYGCALSIAPVVAMSTIHVIEGKPSASSALISSMVRRAGHRLRVTGDDQQAEAIIIRADDPGFEFKATWTMDRARKAGLAGKKVWKEYPAAMLKARAITEVARDACQEALYGIQYTPEELGHDVTDDEAPIQAEIISEVQVEEKASTKPAKAQAPAGREPLTDFGEAERKKLFTEITALVNKVETAVSVDQATGETTPDTNTNLLAAAARLAEAGLIANNSDGKPSFASSSTEQFRAIRDHYKNLAGAA